KAAANAAHTSGSWYRKPMAVAIFAATALHVLLGIIACCAWQITRNSAWVREFFRTAGDLFLAELAAAAFYLALQVRRGFAVGEPLYRGWFLIATSFGFGLAGAIFSKL